MCELMDPFLRDLSRKYPDLEVIMADVGDWSGESIEGLYQAAAKFGIENVAVPAVFLGDQYWIGYNDRIAEEIEAAVTECLEEGCIDAIKDPLPRPSRPSTAEVDTVLFGTVDLDRITLIPATALIAFLDGFNPCSLWVLTFLLGMLLHTGSRRKVILAGGAFLLTTAAVYGLFIIGVVKVLGLLQFNRWIRIGTAVIALIMGGLNIKDFFSFKKGVSLTISDSNRKRIGGRFRRMVSADKSIFALTAAAVLLAAGIALVELPCTAGFPVMWSNVVTSSGAPSGVIFGLLILYLVIYLVDELIILGAAVIGFRRIAIKEKHGRYLKLFGGTVLLSLAGVMIIKPELMESLWSTLIVFAAAAAAALLLVFIKQLTKGVER